uniref:Vinculin n=1 Tax=Panagrellus redivivus TaxID=6233 RepID=A0A7E4ZTX2_PANRE
MTEANNLFDFDKNAVKTRSIQKLVAPLIKKVTELHGDYWQQHAPTTNAPALYRECERTIQQFLTVGGHAIKQVSPLITEESRIKILTRLNVIKDNGDHFLETAENFVQNTSDIEQRIRASEAGRILLLSLVALLVEADKLDVLQIMSQSDKVRDYISGMANARTEAELIECVNLLKAEMTELTQLTHRRLKDITNPAEQDDLQMSLSLLKITTPIMVASSKAHIAHPELHEARANRDFAHSQMHAALTGVQAALNGQPVSEDVGISMYGNLSQLAENLDRFQNHIYMEHSSYRPKHREALERLLEDIVVGAAGVADWNDTRPGRSKQIIDGCNHLRQALQELLTQFELNCKKKEPDDAFGHSTDNAAKKVRDLRRHLRRAIADLVSDAFMDTRTPLITLIKAASDGNVSETQYAGDAFQNHADSMVLVARRVCEMSSDQDANRIVRYAALCCETLAPQVVNAALLLAEKPNSAVAKENMEVFKNAWETRVKMLTSAVDQMISIVDFLAVSEALIQEDTEQALKAIYENNGSTVDNAAGAIRGRSLRVCQVVNAEMEGHTDAYYANNVRAATHELEKSVIPTFVKRAYDIVTSAWEHSQGQGDDIDAEKERDSNEMIETCALIDGAVKEIRAAVLRNHNPEEVDSDNEYIEDGATTNVDNMSQISNDDDNQQVILRKLPEDAKQVIQEHVDVFKRTQREFNTDVGKWDDAGNDLIRIAKQMCLMCDDMTQFTKGRGPLKRTADVITHAQDIATAGNRLNALATEIANDCVESETKKDLQANITKISTLSHQLRITSKVKAEIRHVGDQMEVTGLDSVTSLIENVKNLLKAVILCVRHAYIGSTKFRLRNGGSQRVQWVLAHPDKKNLVQNPRSHGVIRRASEKRAPPPMQALNEFHPQQF